MKDLKAEKERTEKDMGNAEKDKTDTEKQRANNKKDRVAAEQICGATKLACK